MDGPFLVTLYSAYEVIFINIWFLLFNFLGFFNVWLQKRAFASHFGVNDSLQKSVVEAVMPQLILMGILYIRIALLYAKCIPERFHLHSWQLGKYLLLVLTLFINIFMGT